MATPQQRYELELWINDVQVGDISKLAQNRRFKLRRNDREELAFLMNIKAFEQYAASLGAEPQALLEAYVTDIRVKRDGVYMFGTQLTDMQFNLNQGDQNVEVRATGFLDLLKDRYVTKTYTQEERTEIARDLIATTQAGDATNDFGIVDGTNQYNTGLLSDREYIDQNVKDAVVNLTNLSDGNFDFRFNYDRSFETFEKIGSDRPGYKFTYPYNVKSMTIPRTALNLYNYIIGLGSGFGEETLRNETMDYASRLNYKTRQKIITFNSVSLQETLDANTYAFLQQVKDVLELPKLQVSGEHCDLGIIGIGDRIPVEVMGHTLVNLDKTVRIEQIDVSLDENDAEDITLTVDDFSI